MVLPTISSISLPALLFLFLALSAKVQVSTASVVTLLRVPDPLSDPTEAKFAGDALVSVELAVSVVSALPSVAAQAPGMTRYEEVEYFTKVVIRQSDTTRTVISTPEPMRTYTIEHGSGGRIVSADAARTLSFDLGKDQPAVEISHWGSTQNCTFNETEGKGVCVDAFVLAESYLPDETLRSMFTKPYTYTGALVPYATIVVGGARSRASGLAEFGLLGALTLLSTCILYQV